MVFNIALVGSLSELRKEKVNWYSLSPTGLMHYLRIGCYEVRLMPCMD